MLRHWHVGRPSKLDDLVAKRIVDAVAAGVSYVGAAYAARVSRASLMDWLARGRDGEQPYADFLDRVNEARGKSERKVVDALMAKIADGNVPAMMFWLQQRAPEDWNQKAPPANEAVNAASDSEASNDVPLLESLLAAAKSKAGT